MAQKGAMVGAAARGLDLGAGAVALAAVAVVVMVVPVDPALVPAQRRRVGEAAGRRRPGDPDGIAVVEGDRGDQRQHGGFRQGRDDLLRLAPYHHVAAELAQGRLGGRGAVRADRHRAAAAPAQRRQEGARAAELGRGAAPEQVGGRRRHHRHGGRETRHRFGERFGRLAHEVAVEHQHLVAGALQHRPAIAELQRQMRVPAAEIDRLREIPGRVDEGDSHGRAPSEATGRDRVEENVIRPP